LTPTKLLIGQILIVFGIVLAGIWAGTQWAAAALAYQPELGVPWFLVGQWPIYRPWALFGWWYHYDAYAPHVFDEAGTIAGAGGVVRLRIRDRRVGLARTAVSVISRPMVRRAGRGRAMSSGPACSARPVRILGAFGRDAIYVTTAPSMSWRSRRPVRARVSASSCRPCSAGPVRTVVHDIKGENWQLTAGWRSRFSALPLLFNPTDARSARYNPLLEVRRGVA
jgi:type IV secretion system protein VirD4